MAKLQARGLVLGQADLVSSATQLHPVGTRAEDDSGRVFRYVKAGATLVAGNVLQSSAIVADHLGTVSPVVAKGATSFVFAPTSSTAATADKYADGYLQADTTPGNGYTYVVAGNLAGTASVTVTLKDPIQVAFTADTRLGLIANPYRGVIQFPVTTATGTMVGVATYVITSGEYGWIGTWGLFSVLTTATPALGAMVLAPGTAAGSAQVVVAGGNLIVGQIIGHMAQVGANGKNNFVHVRINP